MTLVCFKATAIHMQKAERLVPDEDTTEHLYLHMSVNTWSNGSLAKFAFR
jgi:hypothetical protein